MSDFTSMWSNIMESNNSSTFILISNQLAIAIIFPLIIQIPFQRLKGTSISDDIFISKDFSGFLFRIPTTSILDWSKNCSGYIFIAHKLSFVIEQSGSKESACHNGSWGQFKSAMANVTNCVNIFN